MNKLWKGSVVFLASLLVKNTNYNLEKGEEISYHYLYFILIIRFDFLKLFVTVFLALYCD